MWVQRDNLIDLRLNHLEKGPGFHAETRDSSSPGPVLVFKTGSLDNEERRPSEYRSRSSQVLIGVDECPNSAERVFFIPQIVVRALAVKSQKFLHPTLVEKDGALEVNL